EEQSFNEHSALAVKGSDEDGYDFFVNIDNIHLLSELKPAKNSDIQTIQAKYKFGLVLIGLALLNENGLGHSKDNVEDKEEDTIFEVIARTTKAISPVIIPMIDSLGSLETEDINAMSEEIV